MEAGAPAFAHGTVKPAQKPGVLRLRPKHILFALIGLMYANVLWVNERFLVSPEDPYWPHIEPFQWWLLPHGICAGIALFLGPLQLSDRLRKRYAKLHRIAGRLYVAGVFVGAPLGFYIQYFEERMGGTRSITIAAATDAALWMITTGVALAFILQGKVQQHRQWMVRSFACAIIFLEVRVIVNLTGWEQHGEAIIWTCVAAAVPLADLVLCGQELFRRKANPAKPSRFAPAKLSDKLAVGGTTASPAEDASGYLGRL